MNITTLPKAQPNALAPGTQGPIYHPAEGVAQRGERGPITTLPEAQPNAVSGD